jgi:hypothetical protein
MVIVYWARVQMLGKESKRKIEETGRRIQKKEKDIHRKIEDEKLKNSLGRKYNLLSSQSQKLESTKGF